MATIAIGEEARDAPRPYAPGWLDRLVLFESSFTALMICLVVHGYRQIRLVGRLHAAADRVDLCRRSPCRWSCS